MPRGANQATSEAISTAKARDAKLLRIEAEFNMVRDREEYAGDRVQELEAEFDRLRSRIRKAERKQERRTQEADHLFRKMMETRAFTLEGMIAKARVRARWNADDEHSESATLKSLVRDLERMAK